MKGSSFKYLVKEGVRSLWVNKLMSFASVGVLVACLLLIGAAALFSVNVNNMVGYVAEQNEVVAFVKDDATEQQTAELKNQIQQLENVSQVDYISKEDAFKELKETTGINNALFEGLENENPLPASFRIRLVDLGKIDETVTALSALDGVDSVNAQKDVANTLTDLRKIVNIFGSVMIAVLAVVALVIISNTIRLTVFSRRREINIMKYVGATDAFIRLPFLVEGFLLGFLSALIAFLAVWGGYNGILEWLTGNTSTWLQTAFQNVVPFSQIGWKIGLGFMGLGVVAGTTGSLLSIRRHLRV